MRDPTTHRTYGFGEAIEHRLRPQLVVQCVSVDSELSRRLRDVAFAHVHRSGDVLAFECFDRLRECDSVADQFSDDGVQAIVDADHFVCLTSSGDVGRERDSTTQNSCVTKKNFLLPTLAANP